MQESQPFPSLPEPKGKSRRKLILALGTASFAVIPWAILAVFLTQLFPLLVLFLFLAPVLGGSAWLMANRDLKGIPDGIIPVSAVRATNLGRTLAILGTFGGPALLLLVVAGSHFSSSGIFAVRESMVNELHNLAANAYEYRVLPE